VLFFVVSCTQDPIFYYISQEPELREPRITGTPTNIIEFESSIYVANFTSLYHYRQGPDSKPGWESVPKPGGQIRGLAATRTSLYILTSEGLFKRGTGTNTAWVNVPFEGTLYSNWTVHQIYANSQRLFAGAALSPGNNLDNRDFSVFYEDPVSGLKLLKDGVHLLSGTAFDGTTHFIATTGSGIFAVPEAGLGSTPVLVGEPIANSVDPSDKDRTITGIINLGTDIVAVDRGGEILAVTNSGFTVKAETDTTTGALAVWRTPPVPEDPLPPRTDPGYPDNLAPQLLLVGIQNSRSSLAQTYNNGYREVSLYNGALVPNPITNEISINEPGNSSTPSVSNNEKYTTSLGQLPINYMFQIPCYIDTTMPIFASTQLDGVWTYRDHDNNGNVHWNAE
jgi:hypothetical protein